VLPSQASNSNNLLSTSNQVFTNNPSMVIKVTHSSNTSSILSSPSTIQCTGNSQASSPKVVSKLISSLQHSTWLVLTKLSQLEPPLMLLSSQLLHLHSMFQLQVSLPGHLHSCQRRSKQQWPPLLNSQHLEIKVLTKEELLIRELSNSKRSKMRIPVMENPKNSLSMISIQSVTLASVQRNKCFLLLPIILNITQMQLIFLSGSMIWQPTKRLIEST
jgi:hypothetical protein